MSERRPGARFSIAMQREQLGRMVEYYQPKTLVIDTTETESVSRPPKHRSKPNRLMNFFGGT